VGAFGEKLRKQREQRGIELDAISNTTKISTRMLRAIEDERFDQLPGGVFNKGFVRAYARQVGLDEEEAVADYLAALHQSQQQSILTDVQSPTAKPIAAAREPDDNVRPSLEVAASHNDGDYDEAHDLPRMDRRKHGRRDEDRRNRNEDRRNEDRRSSSEDRHHAGKFQKYPAGDPAQRAGESSAPIPWGKLALTLLLVTLVLAIWNFRRRAEPAPASQSVTFSHQPPAAASASPSAANQPSASASSSTAGLSSPAGNLSPGKSSPATISAAATPPHPEPASSAPPPPTSAPSSATKPAPEPDANPPAVRATPPSSAAKPPTTFTLLIHAEKTTWVSLIADGKPVAHETLIAPAHLSVRATHEIVVKAGNAAGISFLLNGKEIPAQGNEGEVKTYTFDATGLRTE